MTPNDQFKKVALKYAKNGIPVFPCHPKSKSPLTKHGFKDATTDVKKIAKWWDKHPNAIIGAPNEKVATVVDFDFNKGVSVMGWYSIFQEIGFKGAITVTTLSGGKHQYFLPTHTVSRKVGLFKGVDVCGVGGYTCLPDGARYNVFGMKIDDFVRILSNKQLSPIPECIAVAANESVEAAFTPFIKTHPHIVSYLRDDFESKRKPNANSKKLNSILKETCEEAFAEKPSKRDEEIRASIEAARELEDSRMFESVGKENYVTSKDFERNRDGKIWIEPQSLTSEKVNQLFYNQKNQIEIAQYLGIPIPTRVKGKKFRSIIEGHADERPSMGSRWSKNGNHILVRDFSNHFSGKNCETDYNLLRLHVQNCYLKNIQDPTPVKSINAPEFFVWAMKMLKDSGVVDFEIPEIPEAFSDVKFTKSELKVIRGFLELQGIKECYKGYEGATVYSRKFAAAWSGVSETTATRTISRCRGLGLMDKVGTHDAKRGGYSCTLLALGEMRVDVKEAKPEAQSSVNNSTSFRERIMELKEQGTIKDKEAEEKVSSTDNMIGLFGVEIDSAYKETIRNFAQDMGIENVPEDQLLVSIFGTKKEVGGEMESLMSASIVMSDFTLAALDSEDGKKVLVAYYESALADEHISKIVDEYELEEDPKTIDDKYFIISFDYDGDVDDDYLDQLGYKFTEYMPYIEASKEISGFYSENDIDSFRLGYPVSIDD